MTRSTIVSTWCLGVYAFTRCPTYPTPSRRKYENELAVVRYMLDQGAKEETPEKQRAKVMEIMTRQQRISLKVRLHGKGHVASKHVLFCRVPSQRGCF